MKIDELFRDEDGFSTIGMVVALLVTLALIFSSAQVYRVNSVSSRIQDVADACALAAENEVAEFVLAARVCDAALLSLSLAGCVSTGLGVVALCTPISAPASEGLVAAGQRFFEARDSFAKTAAESLNAVQKALPILAVARAALVARSYGNAYGASAPLALAIICPLEGEEISLSLPDTDGLMDDVNEQSSELEEKSRKAEEAAEQANLAKEKAFMADCGAAPDYCMYERAQKLAGMTGRSNPRYSSVDTWSFSVALERARAYYAARLASEAPASSDYEEQARSALRKQLYSYMVSELRTAYVHESEESFSAYFPTAPRNTQEMRGTSLYTDCVYPVSGSGDSLMMHAWSGCPNAAGASRLGSIQEMEQGSYTTCSICGFTASSMGKVAAASSTINNGFEYHYNTVAEAAKEYSDARAKSDPLAREVKERAQGLFDRCLDACKDLLDCRIHVKPPGRNGAIALAVDSSQVIPSGGLGSLFCRGSESLGTRAAVSAATLVTDSSSSDKTILNSLLDSLGSESGIVSGIVQLALDCWSGLLSAFCDGQEAISSALESTLNGLPLIGSSGLGTWAAKAFEDTMDTLGLEPADLRALRPVLVNSLYVASKTEGAVAAHYVSFKNTLTEGAGAIEQVVSWAQGSLESCDVVDALFQDTWEVAVLDLTGFGDGGAITLALPPGAQSAFDSALSFASQLIVGLSEKLRGMSVWS